VSHRGKPDSGETPGTVQRALMGDAEAKHLDDQFQPPTDEQIAADAEQIDRAYGDR